MIFNSLIIFQALVFNENSLMHTCILNLARKFKVLVGLGIALGFLGLVIGGLLIAFVPDWNHSGDYQNLKR